MPPSTMFVSVAQAVSMDMVSYSSAGYIYDRAFASVPNMTEIYGPNSTFATNQTMTESDLEKYSWSAPFHWRHAHELIIVVVMNVILYQWNIWLERSFPTRSRTFAFEKATEKTEMDEQVEEEIIQKWLARGKIKRTSVNWCNVFIKWVLHMSLGLFGLLTMRELLFSLLRWKWGFGISVSSSVVTLLIPN